MTIQSEEEKQNAAQNLPTQPRQQQRGRMQQPDNESTALILASTNYRPGTTHYSQESPASRPIVGGSLTCVGCLTGGVLAAVLPAWWLASGLTDNPTLQGFLFCAFVVAAFFAEAAPSALIGYGVYKLLQRCCNSENDDGDQTYNQLSF
jgi:hypothetical protein